MQHNYGKKILNNLRVTKSLNSLIPVKHTSICVKTEMYDICVIYGIFWDLGQIVFLINLNNSNSRKHHYWYNQNRKQNPPPAPVLVPLTKFKIK